MKLLSNLSRKGDAYAYQMCRMRKGNKQKCNDLPSLQIQHGIFQEKGNETMQGMQHSAGRGRPSFDRLQERSRHH
jgi:hypothetical protein